MEVSLLLPIVEVKIPFFAFSITTPEHFLFSFAESSIEAFPVADSKNLLRFLYSLSVALSYVSFGTHDPSNNHKRIDSEIVAAPIARRIINGIVLKYRFLVTSILLR